MMHSTKGRLRELRARLESRSGQKGFEENCETIRKEIERLEKVIG